MGVEWNPDSLFRKKRATRRVVRLLLVPVRKAQTLITGTCD
jgi:hypothetical protein